MGIGLSLKGVKISLTKCVGKGLVCFCGCQVLAYSSSDALVSLVHFWGGAALHACYVHRMIDNSYAL